MTEGCCPDYGNALFTVINKFSPAQFHLVQTVAVRLLTFTKKWVHPPSRLPPLVP